MEPVFDFVSADADGAIREAEAGVAGDTRASFFRKAAVGGGAVLTSGAFMGMLPEMAMARPSKAQDLRILNFALILEFLEAAFYKEALAKQAAYPRKEVRDLAALVHAHEQTHVTALKKTIKALGGRPAKQPFFDFKGTTDNETDFVATAVVLENTGVNAYLGQAARLQSRALLGTAASIVTIEGRHAAAFLILQGNDPYNPGTGSITPDGAFDVPKSKKRILEAVGKTGFITTQS